MGINSQNSKTIDPLFQRIPPLRAVYVRGLSTFSEYCCRSFGSRDAVNVMSEKWDYLIVLDACRFDYFQKYSTIDGNLQKRMSLGSDTANWIKNNFSGIYPDTICISANSWLSVFMLNRILGRNPFFYVERVWDYGWDDQLGTVPPNVVTENAIKTISRFPDKKAIVFYMQPHHPFIAGKELEWPGKKFIGKHNWVKTVWFALRKGELKLSEVKRAYRDNLKLVLQEVNKLLAQLEGKIVITSDHGNCLGELYLYGHPNIAVTSLRQVPWMVVDEH